MIRSIRLIAALVVAACAALSACDSPAGSEPVAVISITPDTALVPIGTTRQLRATALGQSGKTLSGVSFTWSSANPDIASVSSDGTVTGKAYGKTVITASADGVSGVETVWVTGEPGLNIITAGGITDSISAPLPAPVVVHLRDERGFPIAGEPVFISGTVVGTFEPTMEVHNGAGYSSAVQLYTDSLGTVSVQARMGIKAGPAIIYARHVRLGLADTVRYTVRAGAPARLKATPADSTLFLGRWLTLGTAALTDRGGTAVTGTASFSVLEGPVTVNASGVVNTTAYGTARLEVRVGAAADTVRVTVVPQGALVAVSRFGGMLVTNLDGSGKRVIGGPGRMPAWSPSGDRLVYQEHEYDGKLVTRTLAGEPASLVQQATRGHHLWPRYSRDGQWVYYFSSVNYEPQTIWRVRADGTGLQQISAATASRFSEGHPSPSPDGTAITYFVGGSYETYIHVRNLVTGQVSGRLAQGHAPSWSPTGTLIAFNEIGSSAYPAGIFVMAPDGTGKRRISAPGALYDWSPRWSPDGRWIIASAYGKVHLIEVETGLTIELPFLESILSVDWKPGALLP